MHSPNNAVAGFVLFFDGILLDDQTTGWTIEHNVIDTMITVEGQTNPPNTRILTLDPPTEHGDYGQDNIYIDNYTSAVGHKNIIEESGATW